MADYLDDDFMTAYLPPGYGQYVSTPTLPNGARDRFPPTNVPAPAAPVDPAPAPTGPSVDTAATLASLVPWTRTFSAPRPRDPGPVSLPKDFTYPAYTPTNPADVLKDPSYDFRLGQGLGAMSNAAGAKGLLRSGGTLKALQDYAQNFASSEYKETDTRRRADWQQGLTAAESAFDRQYRALLDEYDANRDTAFGLSEREADAAYKEYTTQFNAWAANEAQKQWAATYGAGVAGQ